MTRQLFTFIFVILFLTTPSYAMVRDESHTPQTNASLKQLHEMLTATQQCYIQLINPAKREKSLSPLVALLIENTTSKELLDVLYKYLSSPRKITKHPPLFHDFIVQLKEKLTAQNDTRLATYVNYVILLIDSIKMETELLKEITLIQIQIEIKLLEKGLRKNYGTPKIAMLLHNNVIFWRETIKKITPQFIEQLLFDQILTLKDSITFSKNNFEQKPDMSAVTDILTSNKRLLTIFNGID